MDTFLKNAEGENISFWFYKGLDEPHDTECFEPETHTLYLPVPDNLAGTSKKTAAAMKAVLEEDWDYLLKTNVSTYLNLENIKKMVDGLEGRDDHNIYGGTFLVNEFSKNVPFPRGHFTILSRSLVEGLLTYTDKLTVSDNMPRTDDTLISLALLYHMHHDLNEKYQDKLMEVPTIRAWDDYALSSPILNDVLAIRCKNEKDKLTTPDNMRKVHKALSKEKRKVSWYKPADLFETGLGNLTYNQYHIVKKALELLKEYKAKFDPPKEV